MNENEIKLLKALLWQLQNHPCCIPEDQTEAALAIYGITWTGRDFLNVPPEASGYGH